MIYKRICTLYFLDTSENIYIYIHIFHDDLCHFRGSLFYIPCSQVPKVAEPKAEGWELERFPAVSRFGPKIGRFFDNLEGGFHFVGKIGET